MLGVAVVNLAPVPEVARVGVPVCGRSRMLTLAAHGAEVEVNIARLGSIVMHGTENVHEGSHTATVTALAIRIARGSNLSPLVRVRAKVNEVLSGYG